MRLVIQRVSFAKVEVEEKLIAEIKNGLLVYCGIGKNDSTEDMDYMAHKLLNLRIFEDSNKKMNLSVLQIKGEILVVSQFTLYGDVSKGFRPSFIEAKEPVEAKELYEYFLRRLCESPLEIKSGLFGAHMKIVSLNDGPVTIIMDSVK